MKTRFAVQHDKAYGRFVEYCTNKHVIEDALTERLFGKEPLDRKYGAAAVALQKSFRDRIIPRVRDQKSPGPPVFDVGPGLIEVFGSREVLEPHVT